MKSFLRKNYLLIIFYIIEAFLYASFLVFDFYNTGVAEYIKYSSILLCLLASLIIIASKKSNFCALFTFLALVFTCVSDYFLLLAHDNSTYILGVFTFFIVQIFYFLIILKRRNFDKFKLELLIRLLVDQSRRSSDASAACLFFSWQVRDRACPYRLSDAQDIHNQDHRRKTHRLHRYCRQHREPSQSHRPLCPGT